VGIIYITSSIFEILVQPLLIILFLSMDIDASGEILCKLTLSSSHNVFNEEISGNKIEFLQNSTCCGGHGNILLKLETIG
jgi:hypothetical protein